MSTFVRFVEENDYEGETWTFLIEKPGNGESLANLEVVANSEGDYGDSNFILYPDDEITEAEAETLVKYANQPGSHMPAFTICRGNLIFTAEQAAGEEVYDWLYKGGIKSFFASADA